MNGNVEDDIYKVGESVQGLFMPASISYQTMISFFIFKDTL